jgi:aconitate hydratase
MDWEGPKEADPNGPEKALTHGDVVIAAITSCTNTSNPSVMVAAGLVAKKAYEKGLRVKPWVKTSMAPGSRVVTSYLEESGLMKFLERQLFNVVGYGCTTCIGNSGPLPEQIAKAVHEKDLVVAAVLSGNRNFEGRINSDVKANYLASPPLVVAYAIAGTLEIDLANDPLGFDPLREPVYLKDVWPSQQEIADTVASCLKADMFRKNYADVYKGDDKWNALAVEESRLYGWEPDSTYVRNPPYFDGMPLDAPASVSDLSGMTALAVLGDSVTTDHISPAGSIKLNSPAGEYLTRQGVTPQMFNSYGSRRGNHEVMIRGTFANVRLRNMLAPGTEGGFTTHLPTGDVITIYEAAQRYASVGTPLLVIAGKEYGTGSSRDWAAKGTLLLGVRAVLTESMERIHRSNLIGMGVLPLQFAPGESAASLRLTGKESFALEGLSKAMSSGFSSGKELAMIASGSDGEKRFRVTVRLDTPQEAEYYRHGGILQFVLRQLLAG